MNLLCPNCQKNITAPDGVAGQVMKCPLCGGSFRAPVLPSVFAAPRGAATPPTGGPPAGPPADVPAAFPPGPTAVPAPLPSPEPTEVTRTPESSLSAPAGPAPTQAEYAHQLRIRLNPHVVRWAAPAALLIVFFLLLCPWLGLFPGDRAVYEQNAWQAAFGTGSALDPELLHLTANANEKELNQETRANWLLIFYLLLFLPTLAATIASAALNVFHVTLPKNIEPLLHWRTGVLALGVLAGLLLLLLQAGVGFSLEHVVAQKNQALVEATAKLRPGMAPEEVTRRRAQDPDFAEWQNKTWLALWGLGRTSAYTLAIWLHVLAILCLLLDLWLTRRGNRPLPELAFRW
jgi:hypothetical protein